MVEEIETIDTIKVIRRDGKKDDFYTERVGVAIKKGFDGVPNSNDYSDKDSNKVLVDVISKINNSYKEKTIKIEQIQDYVVESLKDLGYSEVADSYSHYRNRRNESRNTFHSRYHKLTRAIETISLNDANSVDAKRENANIDGNSAMGTMLHYGSTVSKEFAKAYLINSKYSDAHDSGAIHIHDMDFLPMKTTTCCQIDISELFKDGFSTGHGFLRSPNDIISYAALAAIIIQSNQNDQHGGQSIPTFDYYMAPGVLKSFKKQFKQTLYDFLDLDGFLNLVKFDKVVEQINKLKTVEFNIEDFSSFYEESERLEQIFTIGKEKAILKTNRLTYQAMEAFIHNLNTMHSRAGAQVPFSSINFGTDTSFEGRMVIENYLLATDSGLGNGETPIFPISIFKLKEGVNYNKEDKNYDLFRLACKVSAKRLFPNFSFVDSPFNFEYYKEDDFRTEVAYMGCRTRVMSNIVNPEKAIVTGRGNLSFTSINLPRLGIKNGIVTNEKADIQAFYNDLEELMDMVKDQLLERFEVQCSSKVYNSPFLLGQGVWIDSKGLKPSSRLKPVLKHGTLAIGFIGLAETLKALIGSHHGENKEAKQLGLEIVQFMRNKTDEYAKEYNLNFSLIATPAEGLSGRFVGIDKSIYGSVEGITNRDYYTNSFHVPVYHDISIVDKIEIEGPYHNLTNGGHISYIELDSDTVNNIDAFEKIIRLMHDNHMGYGAINHPVDRDPVCGYTGVIGDVCPGCGRRESEGVSIERVKNANLNAFGGR